MDDEAIAKGLSEAQRKALAADRSRGETSYSMRTSLNTMEALRVRGLVRRKGGIGSTWSPQTAVEWPLTPLGFTVRAILKGES